MSQKKAQRGTRNTETKHATTSPSPHLHHFPPFTRHEPATETLERASSESNRWGNLARSRWPRRWSRSPTWRGRRSSATITTTTPTVTSTSTRPRIRRPRRMNWSRCDARTGGWGTCWSRTWSCSRMSPNCLACWTIALPMCVKACPFLFVSCRSFGAPCLWEFSFPSLEVASDSWPIAIALGVASSLCLGLFLSYMLSA